MLRGLLLFLTTISGFVFGSLGGGAIGVLITNPPPDAVEDQLTSLWLVAGIFSIILGILMLFLVFIIAIFFKRVPSEVIARFAMGIWLATWLMIALGLNQFFPTFSWPSQESYQLFYTGAIMLFGSLALVPLSISLFIKIKALR